MGTVEIVVSCSLIIIITNTCFLSYCIILFIETLGLVNSAAIVVVVISLLGPLAEGLLT